ncbi:MAG: ParA family protein [Ignavibacteriales bacterium]|nr:ParA family protein [Ignavibacteriales bacterium]MBK7978636.1 ParA family protein [Ignavibacteriota bacterium]
MNNIVLSVAAPKGGVGKTTTAVNIAVALSLKNKKTLLLDADPSGFASSAFGYDEDKIFGNVMDLYKKTKSIHSIIHKTELRYLEIIPFAKINYDEEVVFNGLTSDKSIIKEAVNQIKHKYDYVIIDCPPFLYGSTINSLIATDYLIIPVKSSKFSLEAVDKMMNFVTEIKKYENPKLQVDGLLLTMYELNTKAAFNTKKELFEKYPNLVFKTSVPKNTEVAESTFYNKPIILFNSESKASKAYLKLAEELIEKHETLHLMGVTGFDNLDFLDEEPVQKIENENQEIIYFAK